MKAKKSKILSHERHHYAVDFTIISLFRDTFLPTYLCLVTDTMTIQHPPIPKHFCHHTPVRKETWLSQMKQKSLLILLEVMMLGRGAEPIFLESDRNPTLLVNINVSKSTLSLIIKSGSYLVSEREIFTPSNQYPYCSRNAVL